ncbi:MAG: 50S ribosomal protein L22 [Candidatus Brocadiae bacterium]|nr:50S ribosomal protein L22 [Candidatus Brocadiia bacterium]
MDFTATLRFARIAPKKVRLIARLIQGMGINQALTVLRIQKQRGAPMVRKLVQAAWGSAQEKDAGYDEDQFFVKSACVDDGPRIKRMRPRSMGRANVILKRNCHITVILSDGNDAAN